MRLRGQTCPCLHGKQGNYLQVQRNLILFRLQRISPTLLLSLSAPTLGLGGSSTLGQQPSPFLIQPVQRGWDSSHFFLRQQHVVHPVFVRACLIWNFVGNLADLESGVSGGLGDRGRRWTQPIPSILFRSSTRMRCGEASAPELRVSCPGWKVGEAGRREI